MLTAAPFGFRGLFDDFSERAAPLGPHVEVRESHDALRLEIDLPRYREDDVQVDTDVDNGVITVSGRRAATPHPSTAAFGHLLVVSSPLGSFRRSFHVSPALYDLAKVASSMEHGVLTVLIPKQPAGVPPAPLTLFGTTDAAPAPCTADELSAIRRDKDIMIVRKDETASNLTYVCTLSPQVTKSHLSVRLIGTVLELAVNYTRTVKTERSSSTESATYATSFAVPEGTTAADIHTDYEPGELKVSIGKHATASPAIEVRAD